MFSVLQVEVEQLRTKLDKLEKERTDFKHSVDKLETKVCLSATLLQ